MRAMTQRQRIVQLKNTWPVEENPMATAVTREKLIERMESWVQEGTGRLQKFQDDIGRIGPKQAFERSERAFEAAAKLHVADEILQALSKTATPETVQSYAMNATLRRARDAVPHSTSPTSDMMELFILAAWAELFEGLQNNGIFW